MNNVDTLKKRMAQSMVRGQINLENQKYGEFIKQTNEVQVFLAVVILKKSSLPDNDYMENLFGKEFGPLISLFQACAPRTITSYQLLLKLKKYQKDRNRLAHKMFSSKKLTPTECDAAIKEGELILIILRKMTKIDNK